MADDTKNPSERIDQYITETGDWRGTILAEVRKAILAADPEIIEAFKWMGSPVWERDGLLLVADAHKAKVKLTFAHGAKFPDPDKLFSGKDNGNTRRSIDIFENDDVDAAGLTRLVQAAIEFNQQNLKKNKR